ncbi:Transcriptional regulatory protein [Oleoguttula sp. CCFEE 5521]
MDSTKSPLRTIHQDPTRTPTPRPSISPLSTTSKPAKSSPALTKNSMAREEEATHGSKTLNGTAANGDDMDDLDDLDDNRSSSLSEPDDDDEDLEEELEDETDDALGKFTAPMLAEIDSEAETERLEETPEKLRKLAENTGRTPSKLREAATVDTQLSDPPSPIVNLRGYKETRRAFNRANATIAGTKRKRSDAVEDSPLTSQDSEVDDSPRKRSREPTVDLPPDEELHPTVESDVLGDDDSHELDAPTPLVVDRVVPKGVKGVKGKKGKQKGRKAKEHGVEAYGAGAQGDEAQEEQEVEETKQPSEAEIQWKGRITAAFDGAAKLVHAQRSQVLDDRLADIDKELQLLSQPDCAHPEYLRSIACLDSRRAKQQREALAFRAYKIRAIEERTLGERAQLHSQYFQQVREQREEVMYQLGEDWYAIQSERRQQYLDDDARYIYKFPTKKSAQVRQQAKYNQEVSVLSGVAKYVGFPAAPDMPEVKGSGLEADLKAMKLSRRVPVTVAPAQQRIVSQQPTPQPPIAAPPPGHFAATLKPTSTFSERRAHEQFLEQNAWARPQQTVVPAYGTPNLTHTADWVDQPTGGPRHLMRNLSGLGNGGSAYGSKQSSPFTTPIPTPRQMDSERGEVPDVPSSVLAAPPTDIRLQSHGQGVFASSPLQVIKQRPNGTAHDLHDTSRDPSREGIGQATGSRIISGTSTIDAPLSAEKAGGYGYDPQTRQNDPERAEVEIQNGIRREDVASAGPPRPYPAPPHFMHGHGFRPLDGGQGEGRVGVGGSG